MKAYIYSITNLVNGKIYIGSCKSTGIRKSNHFWALKAGRHHSAHLQRAYDKYGKDNFIFKVIEECELEKRAEREIYNISFYKSDHRDFGYNVWEVEEDKFKCAEETKKKLKISHTKEGVHKNCISVDAYRTDGSFLGSYMSIGSCANSLNIKQFLISEILKGKRKSYKKYTFVNSGSLFNYTASTKQRNMSRFYK